MSVCPSVYRNPQFRSNDWEILHTGVLKKTADTTHNFWNENKLPLIFN